MQNVIIEDKRVVTIEVNRKLFPVSIEAPDDIVFGDHYINDEWIRDGYRSPYKPPIPSEQRRQAYLTERFKNDGYPLIVYNAVNLTVDECRIELDFYTYDTDKGTKVREILVPQYNAAKEYFRGKYPD